MADKSQSLTTPERPSFAVVPVEGPDSPLEVIAVNLDGRPLQVRHLTRVTIPPGGGLEWRIHTTQGDRQEEFLLGVVIHQQTTRAYYREAYTGGSDRPDCASDDGVVGRPGPNGEGPTRCIHCPMDDFGSAPNGKGKACAEYANLYLLQSGKALPLVVRISPGSLGAWEEFTQQLSGELTRLDRVVLQVGLEAVKGSGRMGYSRATFEVVDFLDDTQHAGVLAYKAQFEGLVKGRQEDYGRIDEPPQFEEDGSEIDPDSLPFE